MDLLEAAAKIAEKREAAALYDSVDLQQGRGAVIFYKNMASQFRREADEMERQLELARSSQ